MAEIDPGSLDRLHDIVSPAPVPWWPPAPGWYIVGVMGLILLGLGVWVVVARWRKNRYRRVALRELDEIATDAHSPVGLNRLAELVKRVALAAYPRDRVASMTGDAWLAFLDSTGRTDTFTHGPGRPLADIYSPNAPFDHSASPPLVAVARHWIRHHRC